MGRKRKLWLLPLLVCGTLLVGTPVASRIDVGAAPDSPLKLWLRSDVGHQWDNATLWAGIFSSWAADSWSWEADTLPVSRAVTIVVENTGPVPVDDVVVEMESVPGCTRTVGSVAPGPDRRKAFSCTIEPDSAAFVPWQEPALIDKGLVTVPDDVTRPPGAPSRSGEGFAIKIRVSGVAAGEAISTYVGCPESSSGSDCRSIVRNVVDHPDLVMALGPVSESGGQHRVTVSVTNPASYERFVGALEGSVNYAASGWTDSTHLADDLESVWWDLPDVWRQSDAMACGSLPNTIAPGASVTTTCTWSSPVNAPRNIANVTLRSRPFPNLWPIGEPTITRPITSASVALFRSSNQLSIDVTSAVVVGAGQVPTVSVTVSNTGPDPIDDVVVMTPTSHPYGGNAGDHTPTLVGCASSIGTLVGGASHTYTCGGADWLPDQTYFIATGNVRDEGPTAAQDHVTLFDNRAGNTPSFQTEIVPFTYDVASGGAVGFLLRVHLPDDDPGRYRSVHVFDPGQPSCDATPYSYGNGKAETLQVFCRVESSSGTFDWTPTIVLETREWDSITGTYTRQLSVNKQQSQVHRSSVDRDLTVQLSPRSDHIISGSSTLVDVTVTNHSAVDLSLTRTSTMFESTEATATPSFTFLEYWYSAVTLGPECGRDLGTLASGATVTYSCEVHSAVLTYPVDPETIRVIVGVSADTCGGGGCPTYAGSTAELVIGGTDGLQVQLSGPTEQVAAGEQTEFRVRVTNAGGLSYEQLTVWSPDLPSCDQEIKVGDSFRAPELLVPGEPLTDLEFTCTAVAGEQFGSGDVMVHASGGGLAGEGWHRSAATTGVASVVVVESPSVPPTTSLPPTTSPPATTTPPPTTALPPTTSPPATTTPPPTTSPPATTRPVPRSQTVPTTPSPDSSSPGVRAIQSTPRPPRSGEPVVPTRRSGVTPDPGHSAQLDTDSDSSQRRSNDPAPSTEVKGSTEVAGQSEVALPVPKGGPPEVLAPSTDRQEAAPVVAVQRIRARGVVSSAQPATSVSLVLVITIIAMLVVRPLVSRSGRSQVPAIPTETEGPPSTPEELG